MADSQTIDGRLLACTEEPYGAFSDAQTGEVRPAGSTYWIWLDVGFDSDPQQVKVPSAEEYAQVRAEGKGVELRVVATLRAFNSKITRKATLIQVKGPPGPKVVPGGSQAKSA